MKNQIEAQKAYFIMNILQYIHDARLIHCGSESRNKKNDN